MTTRTRSIVAVLLALTLAGCATTPRQRTLSLQDAVVTLQDAWKQTLDAGLVHDAQTIVTVTAAVHHASDAVGWLDDARRRPTTAPADTDWAAVATQAIADAQRLMQQARAGRTITQ